MRDGIGLYPEGVKQQSPGSPRTRGAPWVIVSRCDLYPERVLQDVQPLQGSFAVLPLTQGAPAYRRPWALLFNPCGVKAVCSLLAMERFDFSYRNNLSHRANSRIVASSCAFRMFDAVMR
jgi:hypothetical protein